MAQPESAPPLPGPAPYFSPHPAAGPRPAPTPLVARVNLRPPQPAQRHGRGARDPRRRRPAIATIPASVLWASIVLVDLGRDLPKSTSGLKSVPRSSAIAQLDKPPSNRRSVVLITERLQQTPNGARLPGSPMGRKAGR